LHLLSAEHAIAAVLGWRGGGRRTAADRDRLADCPSAQCRSIRRRPVSGLYCQRDSLWFHEGIGMVPVSRRGILGC
jgi:hypothetical protein